MVRACSRWIGRCMTPCRGVRARATMRAPSTSADRVTRLRCRSAMRGTVARPSARMCWPCRPAGLIRPALPVESTPCGHTAMCRMARQSTCASVSSVRSNARRRISRLHCQHARHDTGGHGASQSKPHRRRHCRRGCGPGAIFCAAHRELRPLRNAHEGCVSLFVVHAARHRCAWDVRALCGALCSTIILMCERR